MTEQHINSKVFHNVAVMYYLLCLSTKQQHYLFYSLFCIYQLFDWTYRIGVWRQQRRWRVPAHHYLNHSHYQSSVHDSSLLPCPPTAITWRVQDGKWQVSKPHPCSFHLSFHVLLLQLSNLSWTVNLLKSRQKNISALCEGCDTLYCLLTSFQWTTSYISLM